jgi:dipeptidyl aminopeptidase/acylaminoacyl peptidase
MLLCRRMVLLAVLAPLVASAAEPRSPDPLAVAFGTMPALWDLRMSPDGSKVAFLQMHPEDLPILVVADLTDGKANLALASTKDGFDIRWCDWANDERLLCGFQAIADKWDSYVVTRLVAVNADGSNMKVLLQHKFANEFAQQQDQVVDWLADDPERVLVTITTVPKSHDVRSTLTPLDIDSGRIQSSVESRPGYVSWLTDGHGSPRLYRYLSEDKLRWHYRPAGDDHWQVLHEAKLTDLDDHYSPVGFGSDPNRVLVVKPHDGRMALWSVDPSGESPDELVFSHPEVDVGDPEFLGKFNRMVAIGYSTDKPHLHYFDATVGAIADRLASKFPDETVNVIDESWDHRYYIVFVGSDRDPGTYYRFDTQENQLLRISAQYPALGERTLAPMQPIRYPARDGVLIPGYLTLPPERPEGPLPTVILPHGGPESRDYWQFDWIAQYLAAKGYAVLQSNYRGSGGYGSDWAGEGGFRAWRTAIGDLTDGAQYLVDQKIADPARICVVGWSYGGYAALMSGVEEPERYRCVVSIAGVADPAMLIDDYRHFLGKSAVKEFVSWEEDVVQHGSPLKRASEFRAPVLLFHGERDVNVTVKHSRRLAKALKRNKKKVQYVEYKGVEHSIRRNADRVDMLDRIGAFLASNLRKPAVAP